MGLEAASELQGKEDILYRFFTVTFLWKKAWQRGGVQA
jgi:hypothetical protein